MVLLFFKFNIDRETGHEVIDYILYLFFLGGGVATRETKKVEKAGLNDLIRTSCI
jgi:hypothetical protein